MIHHRQQLINWVTKNINDPVIQRALEWGRVENCGGFNPLSETSSGILPGWIVAVTSVRNKTYYIAVVLDQYEMRWHRLKQVPWCHWVGDKSSNPVYQGDKPEVYKVLKEHEKNQAKSK